MRRILAVIRREFVERVRQRWFWVMVLLGPLFFGVVFILPTLLTGKSGVKHIAVVDGTSSTFGAQLTERLDRESLFVAVRVPSGPRTIDSLTAAVDAKTIDGFLVVTDAAVDSGKVTYRGESAAQSFSLAYFMGIILYMAILIYGINVMSSVLEEKTTKIVEVLVSSLRPFQLMLGKVIGVGAVSIFQFLIWGVSARLLMSQRRHLLGERGLGDAGAVFQVPHVTADTAAVVGAMSSNEQEARQAQQPVTMLLIVSFVSMFAMLNDPGSTLSVTLSLIPFSSPIAMPVRWAAGSLPFSEVALSLGILFVSIAGVTWIAARIYRVGILMTGKRPNLKELVRWVRTA